MKPKPLPSSIEFLLENPWISSVVSLAVLFAGIATASLALLFASGVMAYGWPFLYVYLTSLKDRPEESAKPATPRPNLIRPPIASVR